MSNPPFYDVALNWMRPLDGDTEGARAFDALRRSLRRENDNLVGWHEQMLFACVFLPSPNCPKFHVFDGIGPARTSVLVRLWMEGMARLAPTVQVAESWVEKRLPGQRNAGGVR